MKRASLAGGWLGILFLPVLACASAGGAAEPSSTGRPLRAGAWGGEGASLQVEAAGVSIEWACASGAIERVPIVDDSGRFGVDGTYRRQGPGPTRQGEEQGAPARYEGTVSGDVLTLKVTLAGASEPVATFTFTYGKKTVVRKCL